MKISNEIVPRISATLQVAAERVLEKSRDDRGDVPGWVLVTVMTAGLVAALWVVADTALAAMFSKAIESVSKP
jgi:hypothetical protein